MHIWECPEHPVTDALPFLMRRYNVKNLQKCLMVLKNKPKVTEGKDFSLEFCFPGEREVLLGLKDGSELLKVSSVMWLVLESLSFPTGSPQRNPPVCLLLCSCHPCASDLLCSLSGCQKVPGTMCYLEIKRKQLPL